MASLLLKVGRMQHKVSPIVIAILNDRWRVVDDGEVQWILQVRKGQETPKSTGWRDRRFHLSRTGLRASIGELCGSIDPEAEAALSELHDNYATNTRSRERAASGGLYPMPGEKENRCFAKETPPARQRQGRSIS